MKALTFFLYVLLFASVHEATSQSLFIGPKVGLNLSRLNGLTDGKTRPGTIAGLSVTWEKFPNVGFNADFLISSKGARRTGQISTDSSNLKWNSYLNLVYLEIPLLIEVYLRKKDQPFRPKFFTGVSTAFRLEASESMRYTKDLANGDFESFSGSQIKSSDYKKNDIGLICGAGFQYRIGNRTNFIFDARYTYGLTNIQSNSQSTPLNNRAFSILLGIHYQISK
ncbi:MAG: PorT family protein [Sporocytophaga sp.]|uniref:porin family protein n=1 Tax=Sporocytophaga sp. TaxID=2231183 RepID=UPI001B172923|nr:porin family protein [Sporocytophaga sp.]MBO9701668.1 PorT family protein [Sporocytophaga sp.]